MLDLAALKGTETVYDLGAGDARFLIAAKKRHPSIQAKGCEVVFTVWLFGRIRVLWSGMPIHLRWGNALTEDFSDADCIFLYLTPYLLTPLTRRFDMLLRPGTIVLSHAFALPGRQPVAVRQVQRSFGPASLYVYRW